MFDMVKLDAKKKNGQILISEDSFEHLLNCLDVQKFISELNADAFTCDHKIIRAKNQVTIDDFNRQCREVLNA